MSRILLSPPPDPNTCTTSEVWQKSMYQWANNLKSTLEQHSRKVDVPVANFDAVSFTTSTTASGLNQIVILPTVTVPGITTGTSTVTAVVGTMTLLDVASANVLATLVQDLINQGILVPSNSRAPNKLVVTTPTPVVTTPTTPTPSPTSPITPARVNAFLSIVGINGQIQSYGAGAAYTNATGIVADAQFIGARLWRDGTAAATAGAQLTAITALAAAGIQFVILPTNAGSFPTLTTAGLITSLHTINTSHSPSPLLAVEGLNEPDNFGITYAGVQGGQGQPFTSIAAFTKAYYTAIKADGTLGSKPVWSMTDCGAETENQGLQYLTVPASSGSLATTGTKFGDVYNMHVYPFYNGAVGFIDPNNAVFNGVHDQYVLQLTQDFVLTNTGGYAGLTIGAVQALPRVITEMGFSTAQGGMTETVRAKNICNGYLIAYLEGFSACFGYEMYDEGDGYGWFSATNAPHTVATYMHNLTTILADMGATAATFTVGSLSAALTGLPVTGQSQLFQRSDLTYLFTIWNNTTNLLNSIPATAVTVTTAATATFNVYDVTTGTTAISTSSGTSVVVQLYDYPIIVSISTPTVSPVPLGVYVGIVGDPADVPSGYPGFDLQYDGFVSVMGRSPQFFTIFMDQSLDPLGNSTGLPANPGYDWTGQGNYQSSLMASDTRTVNSIPIIGVPFGYANSVPNTVNFCASITAGSYDAEIQNMMGQWKAAGYSTLYMRPGWEMGLPFPWGVTSANAAAYVAAFQHFYTTVHTYASGNGMTVKVLWCPNVGQNQNDATVTVAQQFPGAAYCDGIGIDEYSSSVDPGWAGHAPGATTADPTQYYMTTALNMCVTYSKPFHFGEVGGTDIAFVNDLITCLNARSGVVVDFVAIWDVNDTNGLLSFTNASDNQSALAAAWVAGFGPSGSVHN